MSEEKSLIVPAICAMSFAISQILIGDTKAMTSDIGTQLSQTSITITGDTKTESPLACNIGALDPGQRKRIQELLVELRTQTRGVIELQDGYLFELPPEASLIAKAAEYISLERLCCPFFEFTLTAVREGGPVVISLTGCVGVKEFVKAEFDLDKLDLRPANQSKIRPKDSPLVCNDEALNPNQLRRLVFFISEIRTHKQDVKELPDGYAVQLPGPASIIRDVAEYMAILRLCSPYFEPTLKVESEGGPIWLSIRGRTGVKTLAKSELGI